MNNIKYQTFNAGRAGSGRVNLATGKLEFVHEERSNSSTLPINISHVYLSENINQESPYGKGFKLNLHQTLSHREGDDTKWKYTDGNGLDHKFKERYYRMINSKRVYLTGVKSNEIGISFDGKLSYQGEEVFAEIKTKSGLMLQTDLKKFQGSAKIETRRDEIVQLEEEIKTLERNYAELKFSTAEWNATYEPVANVNIPIPIVTGSWSCVNTSNMIGKRYSFQGNVFANASVNTPFGWESIPLSATINKQINATDLPSSFTVQGTNYINGILFYSQIIATITINSITDSVITGTMQFPLLTGGHSGILNLSQIENAYKVNFDGGITDSQQQLINAFQQKFPSKTITTFEHIKLLSEKEACELNAAILELEVRQQYYLLLKEKYEQMLTKEDGQYVHRVTKSSNTYSTLSQPEFSYIDDDGKTLESLSAKITAKNIHNVANAPTSADTTHANNMFDQTTTQNKYNERIERVKKKMEAILVEFSKERCLNDLIDVATKLEQRRFTLRKMYEQFPVNYVVGQDGTVLGFNHKDNGGKLVSIFDSYDNQVTIIHENDRIERVIDNEGREINFEYDIDNRLVAIVDFQDRKTKFEYDNGKLCAVEYPNGEKSIFAYDGNLLNEMIPPSGIGIKLQYDADHKVNSIAQRSYLFDSQTQTICGDTPVYYENTISSESCKMQLSGVYTQKDLFLISYDTVGKQTSVSELIGESGPMLVEKGIKEISYFNQDWGLIAEYRSVIKAGAGYIPEKIVFYDEKKDDYEFVYEQTKFYPNIDYGQQIQDYITNPDPLELEGIKSQFTVGDWIFREFDEETGNIKVEHYNEKTLLGGIKSEIHKTFKHDLLTNLLIEETVHEKFASVATEPLSTRYEYNKQGKLIRTIDAKGVISAIVYDERGNAVKTVTYHKDMPGTKFCKECEVAENGQVKAELNEFCESKTKFKYVDGTNLVCSADVDGNITAFGHDLYTDNVLEITSTADDVVNNIVYKYTNDYLTKLTSGNTNVEYTYDKWGRKTSIQISDTVHVIFHYEMIDKYDANNPCGNIVTTQYANGDAFKTISDKFGNVLEIQRKQGDNWNVVVKYTYDAENQLVTVTDDVAEQITMFDYDSNGNLSETKQGEVTITPRWSSDGESQFVSYKIGANDSQIYTQNLDKFGELKSLVLPTDDIIEIEKDGLGRLCETRLSKVVESIPKECTSVSFAIDDWETIIAVAEAGLSKQYYNVGDEKNCFVGGEPVKYVILGFDHDILADGSGKKSGMTIGLKNLLQTSYAMNPTATNNGGWNASTMRSTVMPSIFAALPSELQSGIKTVDKYTGNGLFYPNMEILTSQDKLFLFSQAEFTKSITNVWAGEGQIYEYWQVRDADADRVKTGNIVNPGLWWHRSASQGTLERFSYTFAQGSSKGSKEADVKLGVCFGFAIGKETAKDIKPLDETENGDTTAADGKTFEHSCSYSYLQKGDHASNLVSRVTQKIGDETIRTRYVYDNSSNITEIRDGYNNLIAKYKYDGLNRLVHENDTEFGYDNNGNILYKKNGDDVIKYEYDGDRLMSYNGEVFEYDVLGNPTTYRNEQMTWDFRNLSEYKGVQFKYAANGLRIKKTCGQNITEYFWAGDKLIAEQRAQDFIEYTQGIEGIAGFRLNNVPYWYVKDLHANIDSIYDSNGKCVAEYKYNAFGEHEVINHTDEKIGDLNAIRWHSYYYDTQTKLYYCMSRYYDPETGRWISPDAIEILDIAKDHINGLNLYAYCFNNWVNDTDPIGMWSWKKFFGWVAVGVLAVASVALIVVTAGAAAPLAVMGAAAGWGALIGMGASVVGQAIQGNGIDPWQVAFNGVIGGASGALMASPLGWLATGAAVGGLGFVGSVGNDLFDNGGNWSKVNWGRAALIGGISGLIAGGGKYLADSGKLMHIATTHSAKVERAATLSRVLGNATSLGRTAYQQFWSTAFRVQATRIVFFANSLRGGSTFIVNSIW